MAQAGERVITERELQDSLQKTNRRIDSILAFLVFIAGSETKNFMIQADCDEFAGAGSTVVFDQPFKTGTTPIVLLTSVDYDIVVLMNSAASATQFTAYGRAGTDWSGATAWANWIAIGERG